MKVTIEYFEGEEVQLYQGIIGVKVKKINEEIRDVDENNIENLSLNGIAYVHNSTPLLLTGVNTQYVLPKPLKLLRIGIPSSLENPEQVKVDYITFYDKDYRLVGFDLTEQFDKPFAVLEFEEGYTKVVLKDEFTNAKGKIKKEKTRKAKRKRKKSAKKASSRQKTKSKSVRKS